MVSRLKNSFILEDLQSVPAGYDFYHFLSTFSYCKHFISIRWNHCSSEHDNHATIARGRPGGGSTFAGVPKGIYGRVSHFGGLSRFLAGGTKKGQHREKRTWNVGLKLKHSFDLHLDAQHWASKWMLGRLKLLFTNLSLQLKNFVGVLWWWVWILRIRQPTQRPSAQKSSKKYGQTVGKNRSDKKSPKNAG